MAPHTGAVSKTVSEQLRRLDRRLHIDRSGQSEWIWAIPAAGFAVWVAIVVVAGVMSGVWAAEYIPTAIIEGLVIAGLFVACTAPEALPPDADRGDRGCEVEPPSSPPFDPSVWVTLLADPDPDGVPAGSGRPEESLRERVGASR